MYKKTLYLCLLTLVAPSHAKIPVAWNNLKGLALSTTIMAGGVKLTNYMVGQSHTAWVLGMGLSTCAGLFFGAKYIIEQDPEYRLEKLTQEYEKIEKHPLLPILQKNETVDELIAGLGYYYAYDQNPYYEAYIDMVALRNKMHNFLIEAEILYDHFQPTPYYIGNYVFSDPHCESTLKEIASRKNVVQQYDKLYAHSLALLKTTPEYRESIMLQQAIEQTEHLERIEQLAWANTMRPTYISINGK